jgi:hypothetical protein
MEVGGEVRSHILFPVLETPFEVANGSTVREMLG